MDKYYIGDRVCSRVGHGLPFVGIVIRVEGEQIIIKEEGEYAGEYVDWESEYEAGDLILLYRDLKRGENETLH